MSIDLDNLSKGTEVKIVDEWRIDSTSGYQNSNGEMDNYLGSYLTIERNNDGFYSMVDDAIWAWSPELFEKVKLPDSNIWHSVEFSPLLNKYVAEEICTENNIVEDRAKYYVFVSGKQTPKVLHDTLEAAEKEAKRLSEREVGSLVSVCKVEKQFISKVIVEEV
jgi:hypothetical protein